MPIGITELIIDFVGFLVPTVINVMIDPHKIPTFENEFTTPITIELEN